MKTIRLQASGLSEKLRYEEAPMPQITDDQVLVRVYAASVNQLDWKLATGKAGSSPMQFPWVPGMDYAGVIADMGRNVTGFANGDLVFGCSKGGAYAEYIAADPAVMVRKPELISFIQAAGAAYVSVTAWQALYDHGNLIPGQRVLIHGAAGAVGAYAVQFAKYSGAEVIATSSAADEEFVRSLGADVVIDYRTTDFSKQVEMLDLVIDLVGGDTLTKSYQVLKPTGRLVTLVAATDDALAEKYKVTAIRMLVHPKGEQLEKIAQMLDCGKLKTDIAAIYPLQSAAEAWDYVLSKDPDKKHGKTVLQVV